MTLGKCRLLKRDVTLTPARIVDITLSRMTLGKCRLLQRDVTLTSARITDITLWRKCVAPAAMLCPGFCTPSLRRRSKKVEKCQTFSDHTYPRVSSRRRGRCVQSLVQIGSEMRICISSIHTYTQTNIHLYI